jgi:pilus assembly protein Flp/PilA
MWVKRRQATHLQREEISMLTRFYVKMQALRGDEGATALEYAILIAFIALAIIGGVTVFGQRLNALFMSISGRVPGM